MEAGREQSCSSKNYAANIVYFSVKSLKRGDFCPMTVLWGSIYPTMTLLLK